MADGHLAIYSNDHLAGAVAALELLEHLEAAYAGSGTAAVAPLAAGLRADVAADRHELEALMGRLHAAFASGTAPAAGRAPGAT